MSSWNYAMMKNCKARLSLSLSDHLPSQGASSLGGSVNIHACSLHLSKFDRGGIDEAEDEYTFFFFSFCEEGNYDIDTYGMILLRQLVGIIISQMSNEMERYMFLQEKEEQSIIRERLVGESLNNSQAAQRPLFQPPSFSSSNPESQRGLIARSSDGAFLLLFLSSFFLDDCL